LVGKIGAEAMPQRKPTIYLDTSIISAFWYESRDLVVKSRRLITRQWWDEERMHFVLFASSGTEEELSAGAYPRQAECLKMVRRLRYLPIDQSVSKLAEILLSKRLVPAAKPGDALQMAIAAAHEVDYLLTWNYAHLANPDAQERLSELCRNIQLRVPVMVSPESIPKVSLGQTIRRKAR
jgi:hypothetical protein